MILNKISAEVPQEQETQALQYVKDIKSLLPFLIGLNMEERIRMAKLSRGRVDMVDRSLIHAVTTPEYLPSYASVAEFKKDVDLRKCLHRIAVEVNSLADNINDTLLQVESEAYRTARLFYKSVKAAASEGAEDAERIAKDLSYHFKRKPTGENNNDNTNSTDNNGSAGNTGTILNRIMEPSFDTK
jgi:hypothetical protein